MDDSPVLSRKAQELRLVELGIEQGILTREVARECLDRQEEFSRKGIEHSLVTLLEQHPAVGPGRVAELQRTVGAQPTCVLPEPPGSSQTLTHLMERGAERGLPRAGDAFGSYVIRREVGRGGMGIVYEAWQESLKRRVALKLLHVHLVSDALSVARFKREAESAAKLAHPHIVHIYEFGEAVGFYYYAMEYLEGQNLEQACQGRPMEPRRVAGYLLEAARALDHAHHLGIIHRDIKPANLFVTLEDKVFITDFGLARPEAGAGLTASGAVVGTPAYMSPEQALGNRVQIDRRSDVYSLCMTLYTLLVGRPAFSGGELHEVLRQVVYEDPPRPTAEVPEIPLDLEAVALKGLAKAPERRYQSALELAGEFRRFLDGDPVEARRPGYFSGKAGKRRAALLAVGLLVIGGGAAVAAFFPQRPGAGSGNGATPGGASVRPENSPAPDAGNAPSGVDRSELERERRERIRAQVEAFDLKAKLFSQDGDMVSAVKCLEAARTLEPDNPARLRNLAIAYGNSGVLLSRAQKWPEAARAYELALAVDPAVPGAWTGRGQALSRLGDEPGARQAFERALALDIKDVSAHLGIAQLDRRAGKFPSARAVLDQAIREVPGNPVLHAARFDVILQSGDREGAEAALADGLANCPDATDLRVARARLLTGEKKWAEAEAELSEVLERDPGREDALIFRAGARERQGKWAEAAADLDRLADSESVEPSSIAALWVEVLIGQQRFADAAAEARRAREAAGDQDPRMRDHFGMGLGFAELRAGRYAEGAAAFRLVIEGGGPTADSARWNLAQCLYQGEDLPAAIAVLRDLATRKPEDESVRRRLAELEAAGAGS